MIRKNISKIVFLLFAAASIMTWKKTGDTPCLVVGIILLFAVFMIALCDFIIEWSQNKIREIQERLDREIENIEDGEDDE